MDLLANAYSTDSVDDDDEDGVPGSEPERRRPVLMHQPKRHRSGNPSYHNEPLPVLHCPIPASTTEILVTSRYVSKRERALALSSAPRVRDPDPLTPVTTIPVVGSISNSKLPHNILALLKRQKTGRTMPNQISERRSVALSGHSKAVNVVQWSTTHAHLLASAGMDGTICIWNAWSIDQKKARVLNYHNAAVKDVKWSQQGLFVLSCGYDCTSRLIDIESGLETQVFKEDQVVGVIKFHPDNSNLFLSGGLLGSLRLWDIRVGKVVHEYIRDLGPILDIEFTLDAKQFISSSDVSKGNISENSIIIWDISRQVPLSNQVYVEAYTCPCIRHHPLDPYFVAQSNGNYIAIFSSKPPFKLDKYKRYESHSVSGFPTKCNFSMDGEKLVSGSSDGCIYFYNSRSTELIKKIKAYEQACIDVAFHPIMPNVIASCSWSGDVSVFE